MIKVWDYFKEYDLLREDILKIVDEVFKCGILIFGPKLEEFKKKFSKYIGSEYGIGVANCTDALRNILLSIIEQKKFDSKYVSEDDKRYLLENYDFIEIFKGNVNEVAFIKKK